MSYSPRCGYTEVVRLLLEAGADVHALNDQALREASQNGHTEVVHLLRKAESDVRQGNIL